MKLRKLVEMETGLKAMSLEETANFDDSLEEFQELEAGENEECPVKKVEEE